MKKIAALCLVISMLFALVSCDWGFANTLFDGISDGKQTDNTDSLEDGDENVFTVYRTPTGKRYYLSPNCGGKNSFSVSMKAALEAGLTPCKKCADQVR